MKKPYCVLLFGMMLGAGAVQAQTIYRCGNSYSQMPCSGGQLVEAQDNRDRAQKQQAEAAVHRDMKAAQQLEKQRVQQDAAHARSMRQGMAGEYYAPPYDPHGEGGFDPGRKTGKKQELFTARSTDEKKPAKKGVPSKSDAK